ncbi:PilW family protein [Hydrogenophaga sp. A37]|uniref:PilW family protein n=1 Tax=Hydrogenophaga sp. A37 TaxID=1945864 RepID=UPI0015C53A41|nr:PilW family protein [Hydrogenophaga sp. A37]
MNNISRRSLQSGTSLIEVMVSLAIGLIILTAIGTVYVNSNNSLRQREDQAQLNDPARIVMRLLRQNLMQAGYVDLFDLDLAGNPQAESLFDAKKVSLSNIYVRDPAIGTIATPISRFYAGLTPVYGCDGAMNNTPQGITSAAPPLVQSCGAANATQHTLRVAYQGVPITAANATNSLLPADTNTGDGLDCLQQAPATPGSADAGTTDGDSLVINQFSVRVTGGVSQLGCRGSGGAAIQDIASGVEEFILRYQMAAPGLAANEAAAGGAQSQYINAALVSASTQGWAGVTAVEICIVSATDQVNRGPAAQGTTVLQPTRPTCQRDGVGAFLPNIDRVAGDTRLWKRFTSVVSLRNAVFATPL